MSWRNASKVISPVYVAERRGRPMSPRPYSPDHVVEREVEDLGAVLEHSGAKCLFGLSSGAVIALEATRVLASIQKLVLYEAPLYVPPRQMRFDLVVRFHYEVETGNIPAAMATALIASGFAPPLLRFAPRPLVEFILMLALRMESRRGASEYPRLRELVPSMRYDSSVVSNMQNRLESFGSLSSDVLLMSCRKSPAYLRESAVSLRHILPHATHIEFKELDHSGPWNADRGGQPSIVAASIRSFLQKQQGPDGATQLKHRAEPQPRPVANSRPHGQM